MLERLAIRQFATVDELDLELAGGLTVLTGETGAGKTIIFDALGLLLGARAEAQQVRAGAERCELEARFRLRSEGAAARWLQNNEYLDEDEPQALLLRRVLKRDGGSRAWLNGRQINLATLRELGEVVLDIHGQHAHQALLRGAEQRRLLDAYGAHQHALDQVRQLHRDLQQCAAQLSALESAELGDSAQRELLQYQFDELSQFAPQPEEFNELNTEFIRLNQVDDLLADCRRAQALLADDGGVEGQLAQALAAAETLQQAQPDLADAAAALQQALDASRDARRDLQAHEDDFEGDPERLAEVSQRLEQWEQLARKHRCAARELGAHWQSLADQLRTADAEDAQRAALLERQAALQAQYSAAAGALSQARTQAAERLQKAVLERLPELGLPHAELQIALDTDTARRGPLGSDEVSILVNMNPGQAPQPLAKVASGGELARLSLAIAVACQLRANVPVLLFDEVDVGVGGAIAEAIGQHLKTLARHDQVICVTHQPQVAAQAREHLLVRKSVRGAQTFTTLEALGEDARVEELSRMAGGKTVTEQTRAHARALLEGGAAA